MQKVATTYEILGTILSNEIGSATEQLIEDPKDFISAKYGVDIGDMNVTVVSNNDNAVNLILPYYRLIETAAQAVETESLDDVAGGEVIFTALGIIVGGGIALGIGLGVSESKKNK